MNQIILIIFAFSLLLANPTKSTPIGGQPEEIQDNEMVSTYCQFRN